MRRHAARRRSTRRHVDDSVIDPCPVGVPRQDRNSASASINFFDEPWAGHTIDLNFLAGDPFHKLNFVHGSLILVRSCRSCPLRHASNLYQASGGPHRRRLGRIHCRSDGRIVDLSLPRVPLAGEPLESAIQRAGNFLFRSHWRLRWRGNDRILPAFSERRAALFCPRHSGRRRRDHGHCWHFVFPRTAFVATASRCRIRDRRFVPPATLARRQSGFDFNLRDFFRRDSGRFLFALEPGI